VNHLFATFGPPEIVAAVLLVVLNAYVLMGGADLGSGVWDLLATGPRRNAQRELIAAAIGPIWEANHVWLIIVVVMLFTAFPPAFAAITTVLHVPISLALVGIVLRGSAFVFRSYGGEQAPARVTWGRTFAIASVVTPLLLGIIVGAIATGAAGDAFAHVGNATFSDVFIAPWLSPFPFTLGLLALALFAQLAATYLTLVAEDVPLRDDFRRRAIGASAAATLFAVAAAVAYPSQGIADPALRSGLRPWLWLGAPVIASGIGIGALWRRHFTAARTAVCIEVSLIVWGWAALQYPFVLPRTMTIRGIAAPASTLDELLVALVIGALVLVPSLAYLLKTFAAHGAVNQRAHTEPE